MSQRTRLRSARTAAIVTAGWLLTLPGAAHPGGECPLEACFIDFDTGCPDGQGQCGAVFTGGGGCVVDNLPFCYDTGLRSYRVAPAAPVTIEFVGDVFELELFFAHVGGGSGEMRFFDADDNEVSEPLLTNGNCAAVMPDLLSVTFETAVRSIEVTATDLNCYIDSFTINANVTGPVGDIDGDCIVGTTDLLQLLGSWGECDNCKDCPADFDDDCLVGTTDLLTLLGNWG